MKREKIEYLRLNIEDFLCASVKSRTSLQELCGYKLFVVVSFACHDEV